MLRTALTGGIASGKTVVSDRLAELGAVVIDADLLAREVVEPGTPALAAIVERFGSHVLRDGVLDRSGLGALVFADPAARRDLEHIVHPAVRARATELERRAGEAAVVVHVIPLLVETSQQDAFDRVVVVDVDPATQLERLRSRNGFSPEEARARVAAQAGREQRLAVADHVVGNDGTVEELRAATDRLWLELHPS